MRHRRNEAGFSLVEVLVTVAIIGVTFAVFVGGMGTSIIASDRHRKQAVAHAGIRNFAEAVKAAPFSTDCANIAAKYLAAYSPPPPTRRSAAGTATSATSHTAPSVVSTSTNAMLLAFYAIAVGTGTERPDGMTSGWEDVNSNSAATSSRVSVLFADQVVTTNSATGSRTATSANAGDSVAQLVSLNRAVGAVAAPTRRGVYYAATPIGSASSLTLQSPSTTAVGDAMVAQVAVRGSTAVTPPPGWTLVSAKTHTSVTSLLYERAATVSGPVAFVWSFSAVTEAAGGIVSYGGASQSAYRATVTSVKYWDTSLSPPAFSATCPAAAETNDTQLVSLRMVSNDDAATETIEIVKRCHQKPFQAGECEDSP